MDKAKIPDPMPATLDFGKRLKSLGPSHDESWKMRRFLLILSQEVMRRIHFRDFGEVGVNFHLQIVMVVFANAGVSGFITRWMRPHFAYNQVTARVSSQTVWARLGSQTSQWPRCAMAFGLFSDV